MTERSFIPVRIAVLTVSDTRTAEDDRSGDTLAKRLSGAGHTLVRRDILPDDRAAITQRLREWCADPDIDVVLTTVDSVDDALARLLEDQDG